MKNSDPHSDSNLFDGAIPFKEAHKLATQAAMAAIRSTSEIEHGLFEDDLAQQALRPKSRVRASSREVQGLTDVYLSILNRSGLLDLRPDA